MKLEARIPNNYTIEEAREILEIISKHVKPHVMIVCDPYPELTVKGKYCIQTAFAPDRDSDYRDGRSDNTEDDDI